MTLTSYGYMPTLLRNKGFKSMVMADGPAGLKLSKKYYKDESGVHSIGSDLPESFLDYMGEDNIKKLQEMMKKNVPADESEIKEQYATAIPIGTAIAQSFNCELAGTYGDVFMPGGKNDFERLLNGIRNGSVPRNQVQQNVTRIYRMAEKLSAVN